MGRRIHWSKDGTIFRNQNQPNSSYVVNPLFTEAVDDVNYKFSGVDAGTYLQDGYHILTWEFPDFVTIDRFRVCFSYNHQNAFNTFNFYTSLNSTNGLDGSFTYIGGLGGSDWSSGYEYAVDLTPVGPSRWLRLALSGDSWGTDGWVSTDIAYMHLFGDYSNEPFVLYDNEITAAPITDWDEFLSSPVPPDGIYWNTQNNSLHKEFKIKNTSAIPANYTVTCRSGIYPHTDALVNDYYRISSVSNPTPVLSFQTPSVAPDGFSEVINVDYTLDAINNPADGYHYFNIVVEETT